MLIRGISTVYPVELGDSVAVGGELRLRETVLPSKSPLSDQASAIPLSHCRSKRRHKFHRFDVSWIEAQRSGNHLIPLSEVAANA